MEQIKTKGLILKVLNLNDNDRIFTVLTHELGKITVMAKGIRSQKNKYFAAMQLFCYSDFVFEKKTGMYYPVGAQLIESFFDLRNSVEKVAFATYITDIVNAMPDEFPIEAPYFSFILNTLYLAAKVDYSRPDGKYALLKLKAIFELKTAAENGYAHSADKCLCCGGRKDIKYFDFISGGVVCQSCTDNAYSADLTEIDDHTYTALQFV
ncbi:MAG: DNA repair protein RecO, partial [Clostridia bacterium]|nr:DNA repair protein RecO [Clostridia bacterium]